ncbi:MAG TPA: CBS domain-containing protein [Myxococcota bacterium]|jgi:CBS domain-containing protein/RNA polymerase-binding transcription factor DksA
MHDVVKSWMSGDPITATADESALAAHERMVRHGIRHLPIVDGERRVVGVLAVDDLRAALPVGANLKAPIADGARAAAAGWTVADLMTHAPDTLSPDDTLQSAAERMADHRIGCLPIVDGAGRLAGILSETDVLRALATHLWTERLTEQRAPIAPEKSLLRELQRERDAVARELAHLSSDDRRRTEQRREPGDLADAGALRSDEQLAEALESAKARRLSALDHALERAAHGRFGVCDRCGDRIPVARLRALPGSTTCIRCAQSEPVSP